MKKSVVIILSVLLAVIFIASLLLYRQYTDKKATLLTCGEQLSALDQKIIQMTRKNTELLGQILAGAENLEKLEKARHRISVLENTAETLSNQAASSNNTITELQDRVKDFQVLISKRNDLIQTKENEIELLRGRLSDCKNEKGAVDERMGRLKSDHESAVLKLNQEIQSRDQKIAEHLKQLEATDDQVQRALQEIADLGSRLSDCKNEKGAVDEQMGQLKSDHESAVLQLNQEIQSRDQKIAEHLKQLEATDDQVQQTRRIIAANQKKIADLGSRLSDCKNEKGATDEQMGHLKSDHESAVLKLNQKIQSRDQKIAKHLKQLEATDKQVQRDRQEITANRKEIADLGSRLSDCKNEKGATDEQMGHLKSDHESAVLKLNQEIQSRDQKIGTLDDTLKIKLSQSNDLEGKLKKSRDKITLLEDQASALRKQMRISETQTVQIKSDHKIAVTTLNQEIAKKDSRITALEKQLKEIKAETIAITDKARTHESRIKYLEQRISKLFGEKELLKTRMGQLKSSYTAITSDLKNQIFKKEVTIEELEGKLSITFVNRILFKFGKATISSQGKDILARVGKTLKELRDKKIRVIGHTDSIPIMEEYRYKFPSNWELSAARSAAVVRFLQTQTGIDPQNLEAVGRSLYDPIASNAMETGRAKNRRVNIIVAPIVE